MSRALDQIAEIHAQIAKGEVYRGYRSLPVAASGVIGLVAAWLQQAGLGLSDPVEYVLYWCAVAACAVLVGGSEIVYNYAAHEDEPARKKTRQVVGQFIPSLAAGAAITACVTHLGTSFVSLLPGTWALCFGLGTFASRPYLTPASGWVAWFYTAAGAVLLWNAHEAWALSGWAVGGTFGAGQFLAGFVLWFNLERRTDGDGA